MSEGRLLVIIIGFEHLLPTYERLQESILELCRFVVHK